MDCLFCSIIEGKQPCQKIYDGENIIAFLDIFPINEGHTLVMTKEHFASFLHVPADRLSKLILVAQKVAAAMKEAYALKGFNIQQNDGLVAGQAIPHIHFHVIPRFHGDGVRIPSGHRPYAEGRIQQVRDKIVAKLNR